MIQRLPKKHMTTEVYIDPDGKLYLVVGGMFAVNNVVHGLRFPFSDFAENLTCLADLERVVVNLTHVQLFGCSEPLPAG